KRMDICGIKTDINVLDKNTSTEELLNLLEQKNKDNSIHGILMFQPLPAHIDSSVIKSSINELKDVDCINPLSSAKMYLEDKNAFVPATPGAVMEILDFYKIPLEGKNVAVLGRSMVVGKPLAMMLLNKNATVTICHSRTKNIANICRNADIIISCIGKEGFVTSEFVNDNSIVIDVGINMNKDNKICGDVDFNDVADIVRAITPVPGGVGGVTTSVLARNIIKAVKLVCN
ncbi:MAG: bifunctional 5,10-methylenetetrahydrofolate dehydrogenase/5,10-methenyltetrahydrofolate cyclohydrolase, partial [Eubacteriaceae bacterium]|nr:bifunctional 5,10-methylenetetrahydrofolate dehydrogenase/5,10-methenyltetrahydrofolate cyclohydrolase [Eubacteriaceae bacterium]